MEIAIAIAMVTGMTQVIKLATGVPTRFAPLLSVLFGMFFIGLTDVSASDMVITGVIVGLSASGLYDIGSKTILNK